MNSSYKISVIGFGDVENIKKLKQEIELLNEISDCKVRYDGEKKGQEYIDYLSNCDIGLSTQIATGEYLKYSFPSKMLSYMSVGLRVVSSNIECVKKSKIGDLYIIMRRIRQNRLLKFYNLSISVMIMIVINILIDLTKNL